MALDAVACPKSRQDMISISIGYACPHRSQSARYPDKNIPNDGEKSERASKCTMPVRNEMAANVYSEPPPAPTSVAALLGLGSTRCEPAIELPEPGTTV